MSPINEFQSKRLHLILAKYMRQIDGSGLERTITIIAFLFIFAIPSRAVLPIHVEEYENLDAYDITFDTGSFGNAAVLWKPTFIFSFDGISGYFSVQGTANFPSGEWMELYVKFATSTEGDIVLKSRCKQILNQGQFRTFIFFPSEELLKGFASYAIKTISIDHLTLPEPYPSKEDLIALFDAGAAKYPSLPYYDAYRKTTNSTQPSDSGQVFWNLTPEAFVNHPFGFLPRIEMTIESAQQKLTEAKWNSSIYEGLLSVVSYSTFEIPYSLFGKKVSNMSMFWYEGRLTKHDLGITQLKRDWNKEEAIKYAQAIYDNLASRGYYPTEVRTPYSHAFFQKALFAGGYTITITASEGSKYESYDSYYIEFDITYPR